VTEVGINRRTWLGLALAAGATAARAETKGLVVFAAASLKSALDEIAATWARDSGKPMPRLSYAASSALARQMEQGAPADLFLSADTDWMDYVERKGLIQAGTRVNLLGNQIVLIAPKDSTITPLLKPGVDVAKALAGGKLSMANVDAVPAGKYGKAALQKLGAWDGVKDKTVQAENVRAALLLVARGEASLGIVYSTDAVAEPTVKVVAVFPADSHPPVIYAAAVTKDAKAPDAKAFLDLLKNAKARPAFEKQGFTVLGKSAT
jgi:molybdate transport system substrate-binding protein